MGLFRCCFGSTNIVGLYLVLVGAAVAELQFGSWTNPRGAIIQDVIAIEGGALVEHNFENGQWIGGANPIVPPGGLFYTISLCEPFLTTTTPAKKLLTHQNVTFESLYSIYEGGGMFATDYAFYTYGGLAWPDQSNLSLGVGYMDMYNENAEVFTPGWDDNWDSDPSISNVQTYRAYGAWASAPAEDLGFWFSGLEAADGAPLDRIDSENPYVTSTKLVTVDMKTRKQAKWSEEDLATSVIGRAQGGLVWLPYGTRGILLAFGGVMSPIDVPGGTGDDKTNNNFMTEIAVYDIANKNWTIQPTLETVPRPEPRAQFCTVATSAADGTAHFVYVYGGQGVTNQDAEAVDELWVLSIPAFEWILVDDGQKNVTHGRKGHICVSPSPTQMISIGGSDGYGMSLENNDLIDVYDLSALQWSHYYDPSLALPYEVPSVITKQIGGTRTGSFTSPSTGLNSNVEGLLSTPYPHSQNIKRYYPRACSSQTPIPEPTPETTPLPTPQATPSWLTPVIATAAAVVGLAIIATVIWCIFRKCMPSATCLTSRGRRVRLWRRQLDPPGPKSEGGSDASEGTRVNSTPVDYFGLKEPQSGTYEMPSNVTSPGCPVYTHGSPHLIVPQSPNSGSVEVDAQSLHEIMNHPSNPRESMSIRNHPMYPRSIAGEYIMSARSDSISHPSEQLMPSRHLGYVSPYELPQDRSNENLPQPPNDNVFNESSATPHPGAGTGEAEHIQSPTGVAFTASVARKPLNSCGQVSSPMPSAVEVQRPNHRRKESSMSLDLPNIPSPDPEEDKRMSQQIEALPDVKEPAMNYLQQQSSQGATRQVRSAYQEHFDEHE